MDRRRSQRGTRQWGEFGSQLLLVDRDRRHPVDLPGQLPAPRHGRTRQRCLRKRLRVRELLGLVVRFHQHLFGRLRVRHDVSMDMGQRRNPTLIEAIVAALVPRSMVRNLPEQARHDRAVGQSVARSVLKPRPDQPPSILLRWSITGVCSCWGLNRTISESFSARTVCPGGQYSRSPERGFSSVPSLKVTVSSPSTR